MTLSPETAKALLNLLTIIGENNDKYPDWIDAVCAAEEALPASLKDELRACVKSVDPEFAG